MTLRLTALCAALAATPALADTPYPVTVTDGRGETVTLETAPENVAALWVGAADLMVALDRPVRGVTTYEGATPLYLGEAMAEAIDLGDITAPNLELMATSDIDLTIGMTRYNAPYAEQIEGFSQFLTYEGFDLETSLAAMEDLGEALGAQEATRAMNADFEALMAEMATQAPQDQPQSVLFIWSFQQTLFGYHEEVLVAEMIAGLGASNPLGPMPEGATADNAFVVLETEDLLNLDPDVIMMFVSHGGAVPMNPAYERLSAYQSGRIWSVGYQYSQPSGPIARELVLREAAHLIWPDTFPTPEMVEAARAVPLDFAQ